MGTENTYTAEEKRKLILETLGNVQIAHPEYFDRCPRCGGYQMRKNMLHNALSRRAKVYVCNMCGMIEAIQDCRREPRTTDYWTLSREVEESQDDGNLNAFGLCLGENDLGHHCMLATVAVTADFQKKLGIQSADDALRVFFDLQNHNLEVLWVESDSGEFCTYDLENCPDLAASLIVSMEMGCFEEYGMSMCEVLNHYLADGSEADAL